MNTYIKNKVVVLVSLLRLNYLLNLKNQEKEEKLKALLRVELFQKNSFLVLKKVLKQSLIVEFWQVSQ